MKTALLLVDATPTFMPEGELPVPEGDAIVHPTQRLIREGDFDEVVDVREEHPLGHISFASTHGQAPFTTKVINGAEEVLWPDHAIEGTANAKLHPELAKERITLTVLKGLRKDAVCYGGFEYADGVPTGLRTELKKRGVEKVVIVGLATDYCVAMTALQAIRNGFETEIILEGCRGVAPETTAAAIKKMREAGINITPTVNAFLKTLRTEKNLPTL